MLCNKIKYFSQYLLLLFSHFSTQRLIALRLYCNRIGEQGAQHLANALQQNQVICFISHTIIDSLFHVDTHHTGPRWQLDR
jgi:hypothetical protein